jgi:hypothetical protein
MPFSKRGTRTSKSPDVSVENVTPRGVWVYVAGKEHFLDYENFPWFREAKLSEIQAVRLIRGSYLRWSKLDVDLELDSLEHPEQYPLTYTP